MFTSSVASPPGEGFWWSQTHSQLANSLWGGYTYKHLVVYLRWARPGSAAVDSVLFIKSISLASSPSFLECACAIDDQNTFDEAAEERMFSHVIAQHRGARGADFTWGARGDGDAVAHKASVPKTSRPFSRTPLEESPNPRPTTAPCL